MKNKRISVSYGRTVSISGYESVKLNASSSGDLEPDEVEATAYVELWKETKEQVRKQVRKVRKQYLGAD